MGCMSPIRYLKGPHPNYVLNKVLTQICNIGEIELYEEKIVGRNGEAKHPFWLIDNMAFPFSRFRGFLIGENEKATARRRRGVKAKAVQFHDTSLLAQG